MPSGSFLMGTASNQKEKKGKEAKKRKRKDDPWGKEVVLGGGTIRTIGTPKNTAHWTKPAGRVQGAPKLRTPEKKHCWKQGLRQGRTRGKYENRKSQLKK